MSRLRWISYFFHRYNWCHVIATAPQLYMILGLGIKLKSCPWGPGGGPWTALRLPWNPLIVARVFLKRENLSFVLVMTDAWCIWIPMFFSYFFLPVFCWLCCILSSPTCCENKGVQWTFLNVNHSLVVFIHFFFMLLVNLFQGLPRIWLWGRMCDPYVKKSFLTAILFL